MAVGHRASLWEGKYGLIPVLKQGSSDCTASRAGTHCSAPQPGKPLSWAVTAVTSWPQVRALGQAAFIPLGQVLPPALAWSLFGARSRCRGLWSETLPVVSPPPIPTPPRTSREQCMKVKV